MTVRRPIESLATLDSSAVPSSFPTRTPRFTPTRIVEPLKSLVEDFIDNELVARLKTFSSLYSIAVFRLYDIETILVMLPQGVQDVELPNQFQGIPILLGEGIAHSYAYEFAIESAKARLEYPCMGSSIGVEGLGVAGTLGLYVKNRHGGVSGLTCHHVLSLPDRPIQTQSCRVMSPQEDDLKHIISDLEEQISSLDGQKEARATMQQWSKVEITERKISTLRDDLDCACRDRTLGYKSAGQYHLSTGRDYIDAALIEIKLETLDMCQALNDPSGRGDISPTRGRTLIHSRRPETLSSEERVEKVGRTSGWTAGRINSIQVRSGMKTQWGFIYDTCACGVVSEDKDSKFTLPGDSGSVVYHDREAIGLVYGGVDGHVNGYNCNITLFSAIDDLRSILQFELMQESDWKHLYGA